MKTNLTEEPKTETRCRCGGEVSEETREHHAMFPQIFALECERCAALTDQKELEKKRAQKREREQRERQERLEIIPPEMRRTDITHPAFNAPLWTHVEGWSPVDGRWLGIVGGAGQCKTRCIALLAKAWILNGYRVHWTTMVEFQSFCDELRGERSAVIEAQRYFRHCKNAQVLVLDDIGKNTWTPTLERHFFDVIDHRKTHDKPLLWTANSSPMELLATGQLSSDRAAPLMGRLIEASKIIRA